jgi:hypothetical protein
MAPFVGTVEIVCGSLALGGVFTRFAVIPLLGVIRCLVFDEDHHVREIWILGDAA